MKLSFRSERGVLVSESLIFLSIYFLLGRMAASEYPGDGEGMAQVDMGQRGKLRRVDVTRRLAAYNMYMNCTHEFHLTIEDSFPFAVIVIRADHVRQDPLALVPRRIRNSYLCKNTAHGLVCACAGQ